MSLRNYTMDELEDELKLRKNIEKNKKIGLKICLDFHDLMDMCESINKDIINGIFCEIDSWIPTTLAPFLTKPDKFPKNYNGVDGERIRTVRK